MGWTEYYYDPSHHRLRMTVCHLIHCNHMQCGALQHTVAWLPEQHAAPCFIKHPKDGIHIHLDLHTNIIFATNESSTKVSCLVKNFWARFITFSSFFPINLVHRFTQTVSWLSLYDISIQQMCNINQKI